MCHGYDYTRSLRHIGQIVSGVVPVTNDPLAHHFRVGPGADKNILNADGSTVDLSHCLPVVLPLTAGLNALTGTNGSIHHLPNERPVCFHPAISSLIRRF